MSTQWHLLILQTVPNPLKDKHSNCHHEQLKEPLDQPNYQVFTCLPRLLPQIHQAMTNQVQWVDPNEMHVWTVMERHFWFILMSLNGCSDGPIDQFFDGPIQNFNSIMART